MLLSVALPALSGYANPREGTLNALKASASSRTIVTIGIDIGKNTFHLIGLDGRGAIVLRQKLPAARSWFASPTCRRV